METSWNKKVIADIPVDELIKMHPHLTEDEVRQAHAKAQPAKEAVKPKEPAKDVK